MSAWRPGDRRADRESMLRVDQAGEYGATRIYAGQLAVLRRNCPEAKLVARMAAQEERHLKRFNSLMTERRVRPTALVPLWRLAGFALGAGTALMGPKAAHACTEAVENVIEEHYAGQVAELADREPGLSAELAQFREEELAHRDRAVAEGAHEARGYALLTAVVRAGCRTAIKISEKV